MPIICPVGLATRGFNDKKDSDKEDESDKKDESNKSKEEGWKEKKPDIHSTAIPTHLMRVISYNCCGPSLPSDMMRTKHPSVCCPEDLLCVFAAAESDNEPSIITPMPDLRHGKHAGAKHGPRRDGRRAAGPTKPREVVGNNGQTAGEEAGIRVHRRPQKRYRRTGGEAGIWWRNRCHSAIANPRPPAPDFPRLGLFQLFLQLPLSLSDFELFRG
ncbi:hypothetical protein K456DRAFT_1757580 [Colletotrichum gloeosporioides 23]|nr:hypothetical protein K456DRAFT_1757580 [Colletotrichum gloeosporioides 23]